MANKERYTKAKIYADAMDKIERYKPSNLMGLISLLDCTYETFYKKIKVDSPEYSEITEALKKEREQVAHKLRKKLIDSNNPTAIISALKMYANEEDRQALNQQSIDLKATGKIDRIDYEKVTRIEGNLDKLTTDELKTLNDLLDKIKE